MNGEIEMLKREFEAFRADVGQQLAGVRADLKALTQEMRELIRVDGDIKRVHDALIRIGKEVDDHEVRLRDVETTGTLTRHRVGATERLYWLAGSSAISILTGVAVYALTR